MCEVNVLRKIPRVWRDEAVAAGVIILVAILTVLPQYLNHSLIVGMDALFHFNRFYDVAQQITHHNFSYFQSNYGFQQTGRIVNALYGPYLAYGLGWLLLHAGSWIRFELFSGVLIEMLAGFGAYILVRVAGSRRRYALVASLIFMLTGWVPAWLTTQEFMGWGAALSPFVLACGVYMLRHPDKHVPIWALAGSAAMLVQTHALSSVIVAVAMVPFVVVTFWRTQHKLRLVLELLASIVIVLLLTANVWGAMLEVFGSNHVLAPYMPLNSGTYTSKLSLGNYGRGTLGGSLGLVCTVAFIAQIAAVVLRRKRSQTDIILTATGAFFLVLSSALIPWNTIVAQHNIVGSYLQFPSRFAPVATLILLAGLARTLSAVTPGLTVNGRKVVAGILAFALVLVGYQTLSDVGRIADEWNKPKLLQSTSSVTLQATDMTEIRTAFTGTDLGLPLQMVTKATPDYLPVPAASVDWLQNNSQYALYHNQTVLVTTPETAAKGQIGNKIDANAYAEQAQTINDASPYVIYYDQIVAKNVDGKFTKRAGSNGRLIISWDAKHKGEIQVPAVAYAHTQVRLNGRRLAASDYARTDIGALIVHQKAGRNTLTLRYVPSRRTTMLLAATPWMWVVFAVSGLVGVLTAHGFFRKRVDK